MASEGKSAKDGADDRSVAVPPEAAAAGEKRFSPDPDEEDVEAIEFVRRLQAEGPIGKMTTANTEYNPKKLSHSWKLDLETGLPDVEGLSRADLLTGFRLFFVNEHDAALHFFEKYEDVPLFAMGKAAIFFVWSQMTLEDVDLSNTITYIRQVEAEVDSRLAALTPKGGWLSSFSAGPPPTAEMLHYRVMSAECTLLTAVMQLLRDSLVEKVKGVVNIRSAWHKYKAVLDSKTTLEDAGGSLDVDSSAGLRFGIGAFNLVASLLPPKVLALVSFLGFPCDRQYGLEELEIAFNGGGVRAPIAALALLTHHVFIQASFCHSGLAFEAPAERVLDRSLTMWKKGGIFLMFRARQCRLLKDLPQALDRFEVAVEVNRTWLPLVHFCCYDRAYTQLYLFDYAASMRDWDRLLAENEWSKAFYAYCSAVMKIMLGRTADAVKDLRDIPELLKQSKKINGRPLPFDRFVKRKIQHYFDPTTGVVSLPFPALEMIYFNNGMPQMPPHLLQRCVDEVSQWRAAENNDPLPIDATAMAALLEGAAHSQLRNTAEAEKYLQGVELFKKQVKVETWVIPYARYELGMLWCRVDADPKERGIPMLKSALKFSGDYAHDLQLAFRIHLVFFEFKVPYEDKFHKSEATAKDSRI